MILTAALDGIYAIMAAAPLKVKRQT